MKVSSAHAAQVARTNSIAILLWFLTLAWVARVTIFIRRRAGTDFAVVDATAIVQILITLVILAIALGSGRTFAMWGMTRRTSIRTLLVYYAICFVSVAWSVLPEYSAYRAIEYISMILGVSLAVFCAPNFRGAERAVLMVTLLVIAMTLIGQTRIHGGISLDVSFWHTNSYTVGAAMLFVYCLGEFGRATGKRRRLLTAMGVVGFLVLALGTSTTSNIATMVGIMIVAMLSRNSKLLIWGGMLAVLMVLFILLGDVEKEELGRTVLGGKSVQDIVELDHRGGLWESLFDLYLDSPVIGHGFAVISTGRGNVTAARPHNSLLSVLLGTGSLGFIFLVVYGFRVFRETMRPVRDRREGALGATGALATGLVNSLGMPMVFDQYEESSLAFVSFTALSIFWVYAPWRSAIRQSTNRIIGAIPTRKKPQPF